MKVSVTEKKTGKAKSMHPHYADILVKTGKYHVTVMEADEPPEAPRKKRRYRRRDMAAET